MRKPILNLALIASLLFSSFTMTQAKVLDNSTTLKSLGRTPIDKITEENFDVMESEINAMSDKEFDDFITKFVSEQSDKNTAKNKLSKLGVQLEFQKADNEYAPLYLSPSYLTLTAYSAHRGHDPYHRLYVSFYWNGEKESRPATYDVLGIYFNKDKADYYGYSHITSDRIWLKDSSQFAIGTILFNVDDSQFNIFTGTFYAAVYVTPTVTGGQFVYGGKYIHTYNTTSTTTSGSASVNFSGTGLAGSIGFSVSTTTIETNWEESVDNAILTW